MSDTDADGKRNQMTRHRRTEGPWMLEKGADSDASDDASGPTHEKWAPESTAPHRLWFIVVIAFLLGLGIYYIYSANVSLSVPRAPKQQPASSIVHLGALCSRLIRDSGWV